MTENEIAQIITATILGFCDGYDRGVYNNPYEDEGRERYFAYRIAYDRGVIDYEMEKNND